MKEIVKTSITNGKKLSLIKETKNLSLTPIEITLFMNEDFIPTNDNDLTVPRRIPVHFRKKKI